MIDRSRFKILMLIYVVLIFILLSRIYYLQVVVGGKEEYVANSIIKRYLPAMRGEIKDRNGELLAYNKKVNAITLVDFEATSDEKNDKLAFLINLIEKNSDTLDVKLPIEYKNGEFYFTESENAILRFKKDVYYRKSVLDLTDVEKNKTAEEVYNDITDFEKGLFKINDKYSVEEKLKIAALRFELFLKRYKKYETIIVSSDISEKTLNSIYEYSVFLPGVEINDYYYREYKYPKSMSNILGYASLSTSDEDVQNKLLGKSGIEYSFDKELSGKSGKELIVIDENKRYLKTVDKKSSKKGKDIVLSIDAKMQDKIYELTEKHLSKIILSKMVNSDSFGSKGKSSVDIKIPITYIYKQIIKNCFFDIKTTKYAKEYLNSYNKTKELVLKDLNNILDGKKIKEPKLYKKYVYNLLKDNEYYIKNIDIEREEYQKYIDNKISLKNFLKWLLSENIIDINRFIDDDKFYSIDEIYSYLKNDIMDLVKDDENLKFVIYEEMINKKTISPNLICILLYDQKVLNKDDDYNLLINSQISAYNFIRKKISECKLTPEILSLEPSTASVVVTDVKTGKVLSLVSYPSYDANKMSNKLDYNYYKQISNYTSYPLINKATMQATAPGSTFKPISSMALLNEGYANEYEKIKCTGIFTDVYPPAKCAVYPGMHGNLNIKEAITKSCNVYFFEKFYKIGENKKSLDLLNKYATYYGLNEKSGVEITEKEPHISDDLSIRSSIGQGTHNFVPVHIAKYTNILANDEKKDLSILNSVGNKVVEPKIKDKDFEIKPYYKSVVKQGMSEVGKRFFTDIKGGVAGKTGTAQESKNYPDHALYTSYSPINNPEVTVTVVIPSGYTSDEAILLAKKVYDYYYDEMREK